MEHEEIRILIDAAANGSLDESGIALVQQHITTCHACGRYAKSLADLDTRLRLSLQSRYPVIPESPILNPVNHIQIKNKARRDQIKRNFARAAAWMGMAVVFVLAISWIIRNTNPKLPAAGPMPSPTASAAATVPSTPTATTPVSSIPTGSTVSYTSAVFPKASFSLEAAMPDLPEIITLYTQDYPQIANPENIAQSSSLFSSNGVLSQTPGEGVDPVYNVSDGYHMLIYANNSPELLNYFDFTRPADSPAANGEPALPYAQAVEIVKSFFAERGLLPDQFLDEPAFSTATGVHIIRLLDGRPIVFGIGVSPSLVDLEGFVNPNGEVEEAHYANRHFRPLFELPIRSADDAWQVFLKDTSQTGYRFVVNPPEKPNAYQNWQRDYPTGERVDLYGYPWIIKPIETGNAAVAFLSDWLVSGDGAAAFAAQVSPYDFLHTWGKIKADEQGRQIFKIEGWEESPYEDLLLMGTIRRSGEQTFLTTDQGRFALLDAPDGLTDGMNANIRGVSQDGTTLDWSTIDNNQYPEGGYGMLDACAGGGGGGGDDAFGGGQFKAINLQGKAGGADATTTPFMPPSPFQEGDKVEGATGFILAAQHIFADGSQALEVNLRADSWEKYGDFGQYWQARLQGDAAEALAQLNDLPVAIWGKVTGSTSDGWPVIAVNRFEEVYPGLRIQAWLGTWQPITLDGQEVLIFSTSDGKQYVLSSSIQMGIGAAVGREGDQVIIEGLAEPGKTFGGYPVITEMGGSMAQDITDLSEYEISSGRLGVWDDRGDQAVDFGTLSGLGRVTRVELAYAAASLQQCGGLERVNDPTQAPWLYVQPIWRFIGTFDDGRFFEIQVQALPDEYLK